MGVLSFSSRGAAWSASVHADPLGGCCDARDLWPPPPLGMITFVNVDKVKPKANPGQCFLLAGFVEDGETKGGLLAFRMPPEAMPDPEYPSGYEMPLPFMGNAR